MAHLPHHVSVIMDGNGRWAEKRNKKRPYGHQHGVSAAREIIQTAAEMRVCELTLFGFSSENRDRPDHEVKSLIQMFFEALSDIKDLVKNGIRLKFIGDLDFFGRQLVTRMRRVEEQTEKGATMQLNIAVNYSGRWDITQAARQVFGNMEERQTEDLQDDIGKHLLVRDTDLIIRTGGECRISNFLLWQGAYAEIYFVETLWPDFTPSEFRTALKWFSSRQRRFGKTPVQLQ